MNKDDENYNLMDEKRVKYMGKTMTIVRNNGVEVSEWEIDEIELAFEEGFAQGYNSGYKSGRNRLKELV